MKFSIIGTGFILPSHVSAIRDIGGEIVDVVNDARHPDAWKEMIATTDAECIVILAPNDLHFPMAVAALDRGKKVLCEKPLALNADQVRKLANYEGIFVVHQLRHHPLFEELKEDTRKHKGPHRVELDISVYRDPHYFSCWKGQNERSGGPLLNLGVHYFDAFLHIFGAPEHTETFFLDEKTGEGVMKGENYECSWRISVGEQRNNQRRVFCVNGKDYNFSSKDNLSFENLHLPVYRNLLEGKGVSPRDVYSVHLLIDKLND